MNSYKKLLVKILIIVVIWILLIAGCISSPQRKTMKPSTDWSRGVSIARNVTGSLGMAVSESGDRIYLSWTQQSQDGIQIMYLQMDGKANKLLEKALSIPAGRYRNVRLNLAEDGTIHFLWEFREQNGANWDLYYARIVSNTGEFIQEPIRLSNPSGADFYDYTGDNQSGLVVVWESYQGEIFLQRISASGELHGDPEMVTKTGQHPVIRMDAEDVSHIVWLADRDVMVGAVKNEDPQQVEEFRVGIIEYGTRDTLDGPVLGLSEGWAYVLWSVTSQSGIEAGTGRTEYISFPLSAPRYSHPSRLGILREENPEYQLLESIFSISEMVPPAPAPLSAEFILQPAVDTSRLPELAGAVSANLLYRQQTYMQVVLVLFKNGEFQGYETASKTEGMSGQPIIRTDGNGNLYLAWREGAFGQEIYFTTTSLVGNKSLNSTSVADIVNALLTGSVEGLATVMFFPIFGFGWILPGLLLVGFWKVIRENESIKEWPSRFLLIISIVGYQVLKILFLPVILEYIPFSAWIYIPEGIAHILQIGVPVCIFTISIGVAAWIRKRKMTDSTIIYYLGFTIPDALLTFIIYGVTLLGIY